MDRDPYRLPSSAPATDRTEPARIFGLETEYAVVYVPGEGEASRPPFDLLESLIFAALLSLRRAGAAAGLKGGYFLENGGLVHLEVYLREQSDTAILEAATPECRSPWDLLVYSRAFDHLLARVSEAATRRLHEDHGFRGRLAFGKNNQDCRGTGFGCHENYLVHHETSRAARALYLLSLPAIALCLIPALLALLVTMLLATAAAVLLRRPPLPVRWAWRGWRWLGRRFPVLRNLPALYYLATNALLLPAIWTCSCVLRALALRPFVRELTSFLVTRQILCGGGTLNFQKRRYELSQRAGLTSTLRSIVMFGRRKTIFDLKAFLYSPLAFFRAQKRLAVTAGDSNLSDVPNVLKTGTTALLLEMVEAGETFEDLRLARPLRALRQVSLDGPWKQLALRGGARRTALEIQREYLRRARRFFARRQEGQRQRHRQVLELWEETLERLAEAPGRLGDTLDWCAKKSLLDTAVLAETNWKTFFCWGHVFLRAGLRAAIEAASLEALLGRVPLWRRWKLRRLVARWKLEPGAFARQRDLYLAARKIDLRYHEVSGEGGYQRRLESEGLIRRLTVEEDVERASREPPADTRARVRGYYIRLNPLPDSLQVSWSGIALHGPERHIPLPDPFHHRLPGE